MRIFTAHNFTDNQHTHIKKKACDDDQLPFPHKRAWRPTFFIASFGALIIHFMLRKLKEICWGRIKDAAESVQKKKRYLR